MIKVTALYRYPVKGLSPERLSDATLEKGATMPFDRAFAIENGPSGFDPENPQHLPKIRFLMLMKNERLATFESRFDEGTQELSITPKDGGSAGFSGSLATAEGRAALEAWVAEEFAAELRGPPRLLRVPGHSFSDVRTKSLHLVNLASLRALEEKLGRSLDPLRFRPNIVIDGAPPFAEFDWIGKTLDLPEITLSGRKRTQRCAATNVDPKTGARDAALPRALLELYGHSDFGIYLTAATAGSLREGDAFSPPA
ncbi:MOSC domain-containing protein [Afifella aestuarii]|uniref:MOSC domain-containing protein n=1 Tax=Afifella aestuarii TaxID=1909496 RepID=UPI000FE2AE2C|nr:MOSC domain-containing protein [Afifella aestuarii]